VDWGATKVESEHAEDDEGVMPSAIEGGAVPAGKFQNRRTLDNAGQIIYYRLTQFRKD